MSYYNFVKIKHPLSENGNVEVEIQDQHTKIFDAYFAKVIGDPETLSTDAVINEYTIEVTAGHGITTGDFIVLYDAVSARIYRGEVVNVATNTVTSRGFKSIPWTSCNCLKISPACSTGSALPLLKRSSIFWACLRSIGVRKKRVKLFSSGILVIAE